MNLGEITETIKSIAANTSANDLDTMILNDVNRAYRKLCRGRTFGALIVRGEQFSTVQDTMTYILPYPLERIINDSLRYDVTSNSSGHIVTVINAGSTERTMYSGLWPQGSCPRIASIAQGVQNQDSMNGQSTVSVDNLGDTVTAAFPVFNSGMVGSYIRFGSDSASKNGGDYGYRIDEVQDTSTVFLESILYRGPSLSGATFQCPPSNSLWLTFEPIFSDPAKVVQFDWYSKPQRLYNPDDVPEIPELSDAIVYRVLADNPLYHRPASFDRLNYVEIAREEFVSALKTGLQ